ncbi:hypothetical protein [Francisella philomiragia]|uniref:hypothetical protein n=1 Tax=Francisella philomiragia TaxID=28110 RepID=UPI002243DF44|nr:hypothetical protein [Francisella philomiragia]
MKNQPVSLEQMIADRASTAINQLVAEALASIEAEKQIIEQLDEVAYPVNMIAVLVGKKPITIQTWFDNGKLTNVAPPTERKKAKFKEFKHLIGGK